MAKPLTIELYKSRSLKAPINGVWRWRTRSPHNGKVLAMASEGYQRKQAAVAMIYYHFGPRAVYKDLSEK